MPAIHIIVEGKVQGVSFRVNAKRAAESKGITGWVKNTAAGNVEIMAIGTEQNLQQFIEWCKQGPALAKVANVKVTPQQEQGFERFTIEG